MSENGGGGGLECVVEYEYTAELGDELTLRVGDVITHVERMEGGWWRGSLRGNVGMFPDNFVKVLPGTSVVGGLKGEGGETIAYGKKRCRVLFSYTPAHDDELSLEVDETIDYICEVEDGWWKGRLNGRVGVFPSNFVEMCNSDCDLTPNNHAATVLEKNKKNSLQGSPMTNGSSVFSHSTPNRVSDTAVHKENNSSRNNESINKENRNTEQNSANLSVNSPSSQMNGSMTTSERLLRNTAPAPDTAPRLPPKPVKEQCVVLFPYTSQNDDELNLAEGQIITIVSREVEDQGWWKGELDGKVGVFPDNFVKMLSHTQPAQEEDRDKKLQRSRGSSSEHIHSSPTVGTKLNAGTNLKRSASSVKEKAETFSSSAGVKQQTDSSAAHNKSDSSLGGGLKSSSKGSTEKLSKKVGDIFKKSSASLYDKSRSFGKSESDSRLLSSMPPVSTASRSPVFDKSANSSAAESSKSAKHAEVKKSVPVSEEKDREEVIEVVNHSDKSLSLDGVEREETLNNVTAKRVKAPKRRPPSTIFLKEKIAENSTMVLDESEEDDSTKKDTGVSKELGGEEEQNQNSGVVLREKAGKVIGMPVFPPKESGKEDAQKPSWLEELSRKQANRRSGIFSDEKKPDLPSPEQKPVLPSKPSDNRKSMGNFSRRPNSFGEKQKSDSGEKPTRPPFPSLLSKASSSSTLPEPSVADSIAGKATVAASVGDSSNRTGGGSGVTKSSSSSSSSSSDKRRQTAGSDSADKKTTDLSRKVSDSSRKTSSTAGGTKAEGSGSGAPRKHSDLTRKHSGSSHSSSTIKTATSEVTKSTTTTTTPAVHSTNLGRPEGRSFAGVPERPADIKTDAKSLMFGGSRRQTGHSSSAKSSTDSDHNDSVFIKNEPQQQVPTLTNNNNADIGWRQQILKPEKRPTAAVGSIPPITQEEAHAHKAVSVEHQVEELRTSLASVQAEFAGQITALKSLLEKEREKRIDLEAEVARLRQLVSERKE